MLFSAFICLRGIGFPFERKVLGLAFYVQMSSLRRTARALSEFRSVSKTAVWRWIVKLKACLSLSVDVKPRRFIAVYSC